MINQEIDFSMQENVKRGASVIFWLKVTLALFILIDIVSEICISVGRTELEPFQNGAPPSLSLIFVVLGLLFLFLISVIPFFIALIKFCVWLYYAERNLRKHTATTFSPLGAVICTCIPIIGQLMDYFIYKDILCHQKGIFVLHNVNTKPVPTKELNAFLGIAVVLILGTQLSDFMAARTICAALAVAFVVYSIRFIKLITENEKKMNNMFLDDTLNRKVEEIMRQRGIV